MEVSVTLYAGLQERHGPRLTLHLGEPATVEDLLRRLGFAQHDVEIVAVNGVLAQYDTPLADGARVSLAPFIGGG